MMDGLPDELLLNIFYRLPVKALGSCILVKKPWLYLIKSPSFISSYNINDGQNNEYFIFCNGNYDLELHADNEGFDLHRVFTRWEQRNTRVLIPASCCNGTMCVTDNKKGVPIVLWNPAIRKTLTLPKPNLVVAKCNHLLGFAYDSIEDDYKVLRMLIDVHSLPQVEIFSLNRNSWKTISEFAPNFNYREPVQPCFNGALHWIGYYGSNHKAVILGFDVNKEEFRVLPLPEALEENKLKPTLLVFEKSSLALCRYFESPQFHIEIWVMKEYGDVESWSKLWNYGFHELGYGDVLGFRNDGKLLCTVFNRDQVVVSVDLETGESEVLLEEAPYTSFDGLKYRETLFLLDNAQAQSYIPHAQA
ncbi:F-box/kelch-repeat protein At3g06240-like [Rutidosis leptorrhynchoides]|uniref:F-box/kelch-repeat protein At3g06240-like n=1 Tax=Rutidosis leptorrhynchoides TaxID=125765 RepID=UPI003A990B29